MDVVVFFVPPQVFIGGGVLSIFSIAGESRQILGDTAKVYVSVYPGNESYGKHPLLDSDEVVVDFDSVVKENSKPATLRLNVPEYAADEIFRGLQPYRPYLEGAGSLHVNILNQNTELMPPPAVIGKYFAITPDVTQTTAHSRYATQSASDAWAIPTMHLSMYIDRAGYRRVPAEEKDWVLLYSPDHHDSRQKVLDAIAARLPDLPLVEINGLTYSEYKQRIARAAFVVTFGEGMDGYFLESLYSGTAAFAVYNETFFPDASFASLPNVFGSYDEMAEVLPDQIARLAADPPSYEHLVTTAADLAAQHNNRSGYLERLDRFYRGDFDHFPAPAAINALLGEVCRELGDALTSRQISEGELESERRRATDLADHLNVTQAALLATRKALAETRSKLTAERAEHKQLQREYQLNLRKLERAEAALLRVRSSLIWRATRPLRTMNSRASRSR